MKIPLEQSKNISEIAINLVLGRYITITGGLLSIRTSLVFYANELDKLSGIQEINNVIGMTNYSLSMLYSTSRNTLVYVSEMEQKALELQDKINKKLKVLGNSYNGGKYMLTENQKISLTEIIRVGKNIGWDKIKIYEDVNNFTINGNKEHYYIGYTLNNKLVKPIEKEKGELRYFKKSLRISKPTFKNFLLNSYIYPLGYLEKTENAFIAEYGINFEKINTVIPVPKESLTIRQKLTKLKKEKKANKKEKALKQFNEQGKIPLFSDIVDYKKEVAKQNYFRVYSLIEGKKAYADEMTGDGVLFMDLNIASQILNIPCVELKAIVDDEKMEDVTKVMELHQKINSTVGLDRFIMEYYRKDKKAIQRILSYNTLISKKEKVDGEEFYIIQWQECN